MAWAIDGPNRLSQQAVPYVCVGDDKCIDFPNIFPASQLLETLPRDSTCAKQARTGQRLSRQIRFALVLQMLPRAHRQSGLPAGLACRPASIRYLGSSRVLAPSTMVPVKWSDGTAKLLRA